jgi:hypothetical protein
VFYDLLRFFVEFWKSGFELLHEIYVKAESVQT